MKKCNHVNKIPQLILGGIIVIFTFTFSVFPLVMDSSKLPVRDIPILDETRTYFSSSKGINTKQKCFRMTYDAQKGRMLYQDAELEGMRFYSMEELGRYVITNDIGKNIYAWRLEIAANVPYSHVDTLCTLISLLGSSHLNTIIFKAYSSENKTINAGICFTFPKRDVHFSTKTHILQWFEFPPQSPLPPASDDIHNLKITNTSILLDEKQIDVPAWRAFLKTEYLKIDSYTTIQVYTANNVLYQRWLEIVSIFDIELHKARSQKAQELFSESSYDMLTLEQKKMVREQMNYIGLELYPL